MDDFTFPATAAAAEPAALCLHHHHHQQQQHPFSFPHFASSPLWFPDVAVAAAAPVVVASRTGGMEDAIQEPAPDAGRLKEEGEREGGGEEEEEEDDDDDEEEEVRGAGVGGEDKMDLLWENFNEELRRAGSCSKAAACWLELSDTESEPAERGGRGCVPMLRPSSRACGTGHYRRASSWVLLMRIFRRLFVVEKTITAASRRRPARPH